MTQTTLPPQVTKCLNCGTMLTNAHGVRVESAIFSGSLPWFPFDREVAVVWARCEPCYAVARSLTWRHDIVPAWRHDSSIGI